MKSYKGAVVGDLSPHVFAIAEAAYRSVYSIYSQIFFLNGILISSLFAIIRAMITEEKSNSILVSGESGAGKTETTKMLMCYLAFLGGHTASEGRTVEKQVLEVRRLSNSGLWLFFIVCLIVAYTKTLFKATCSCSSRK